MAMKLVLSDATYFKDSVTVISELVHEARFKINKDGLELVAMDPANVAMVIFKLLSSCFTEYQVDKDTEIAINLANLKQILKRAKANDVLSLEVTSDNKLKVQLKSGSVRTFSIPIIDIEEREQRIPNLSFPLVVTTRSSILNDAIDDADIVAEAVTLAVDSDRLTVSAEGDLSKANIEIESDDETKITTEIKAKIKSKYSIEYLKKMLQAGKLSEFVSIYFNQDYPLKLEYKVIDKLSLSFILAPRVEND